MLTSAKALAEDRRELLVFSLAARPLSPGRLLALAAASLFIIFLAYTLPAARTLGDAGAGTCQSLVPNGTVPFAFVLRVRGQKCPRPSRAGQGGRKMARSNALPPTPRWRALAVPEDPPLAAASTLYVSLDVSPKLVDVGESPG